MENQLPEVQNLSKEFFQQYWEKTPFWITNIVRTVNWSAYGIAQNKSELPTGTRIFCSCCQHTMFSSWRHAKQWLHMLIIALLTW